MTKKFPVAKDGAFLGYADEAQIIASKGALTKIDDTDKETALREAVATAADTSAQAAREAKTAEWQAFGTEPEA